MAALEPHGPVFLGVHIWQTPWQNILETFNCSIHSRQQGHCQSLIARATGGVSSDSGSRCGRGRGAGATGPEPRACALGEPRHPCCAAAPLRGPCGSLPGSLLLAAPLCGPQTEACALAPAAGVGRLPEDTLEEAAAAASCAWGARRHGQRRPGCGWGPGVAGGKEPSWALSAPPLGSGGGVPSRAGAPPRAARGTREAPGTLSPGSSAVSAGRLRV